MYSMGSFVPTPRTTVRRLAKRAMYDREVVYAILDEAFICHVGFISGESPVVLPTAYGRDGDQLYLHGSAANHMLRIAAAGAELCIAVTLVDGLVMARSAFHHSINYRSVVIFGKGQVITEPADKTEALRCISEHVTPGRWAEVRPPTENELKVTAVIAVPLDEVSAKVRTGGPVDDEEDYRLPVWAGVLPLALCPLATVDDGRVPDGIAVAKSVAGWQRRRSRGEIS